jgi:hypothetical protein
MATGTTTVDFGTGKTDVSVAVSLPSIAGGQLVEAWLLPAVTATNEIDNHLIEDLTVIAHSVNAGVGFTVYVKCNTGLAHGIYNIAYASA